MTRPRLDPDTIATLTARHITAETVEDDGELRLWIEDGGGAAVEILHEVGDPEEAARALLQFAAVVREHAECIRSRHRLHTAGWT